MAKTRSNPTAIEVLGELRDPSILPQVEELAKRVEDSDRAQSSWMRKQLRLTRLMFGPRAKRVFPWKGASNVNIPLIDGIVRRHNPGIVALTLDANPVATFSSPDHEDDAPARKAEAFFNWMFGEQMKTAEEVVRLVNLYARRGHAYSREGWKYETERFTRVARANELYPQGVEQTIRAQLQEQAALQQQAAVNGEDPPPDKSPVELVAEKLADEYGMNIQDPDEAEQLFVAAQKILDGEAFIRITYNAVQEDRPDWRALDPIDVITDQDAPDVEDADYFCIVHRMTADQVLRCARDGKFEKNTAMEVAENIRTADDRSSTQHAQGEGLREQLRQLMNQRAGVNNDVGKRAGIPRSIVWEMFAKLDINGDGINERCVVWYSPDDKKVLAIYEYPFSFAKWPVTLYKFEAYAKRPMESRGIPELLYELQKLVNAQHNARLDAGQIMLAPVLQARITGARIDQMQRWRPGAVFPVTQVGDIGPIPMDLRPLTELLREEQTTQRIAESYIGTFDATIANLQNNSERRTAAEVNAITQLAANVFGLDARMYQTSMARSLAKVWNLYLDLGPDQTFFRVMNEPKPRLAKKHEIGMKFDIKPAGSPSSTNRNFMLSAIERAMPVLLQDQSGAFDRTELTKAWLELVDIKLTDRISRSPDQTQAAQLVQQAAQIAAQQNGGDPNQVAPP